MGFINSMRNCGRDNFIYKAVRLSIEDHFAKNDRREWLLDFPGLTKIICNCQLKSLWGDVKKSTWGKSCLTCPYLKANLTSVKILGFHE